MEELKEKAGVHYIRLQNDLVFETFQSFKKESGLTADEAVKQLLNGSNAKQAMLAALKSKIAALELEV